MSIGHGAFIGIAAYSVGILFNRYNLSPWIGMIIGLAAVVLLAGTFGLSCFRYGITGHYFAITSLVLTEILVLLIIAFREVTGGRLGFTLKRIVPSSMEQQVIYFQFNERLVFYYLALVLLLFSLYIWKKIDKSKARIALKAIGNDEVGASCLGIPVVKYKTAVTIISAFVTGLGGVLYAQYTMYLNPISLAGVGISMDITLKAILGGMFTWLGPTVGTIIIIVLQEVVRVFFGAKYLGWSVVGYGIMIIVLIIFLPEGFYGTLRRKWKRLKNI